MNMNVRTKFQWVGIEKNSSRNRKMWPISLVSIEPRVKPNTVIGKTQSVIGMSHRMYGCAVLRVTYAPATATSAIARGARYKGHMSDWPGTRLKAYVTFTTTVWSFLQKTMYGSWTRAVQVPFTEIAVVL